MTTPQTSRVTNLDELILGVKFDGAQIKDGTVPAAALAANAGGLVSGQIDHCFYIAGAQTTGVEKLAFLIGKNETIVDIRAYLETAPTTSSFIIDVNQNGTTVFTTQGNRPTIATSAHASSTTLPDIVALTAGDRITVDIDQIGSGTAGTGLFVTITTTGALT
jgi:hypothetical protein